MNNPEVNCAVHAFSIFHAEDGFHIAVQIQGPKLRCQFVMSSPFATRENAEKWLMLLTEGEPLTAIDPAFQKQTLVEGNRLKDEMSANDILNREG